jgi:hypothetical protein
MSIGKINENAENKSIAIYHVVYKNEGFEKSAKIIFKLVKDAQEKSPDKDRHLYLDIEGYLQGKHKHMDEMLELQKDFILEYLMQSNWIKEVSTPLFKVTNPNPQQNDIPKGLLINDKR